VNRTKLFAIVLGAVLALFPNIAHLADLRYRLDPVLERSVCRSIVCSDTLLLESAERTARGSRDDREFTLANLQEALRRNVVSPYRWSDLGQAFLSLGRREEAGYCFARALELGPQSPPILWRAALFYSRVKDPNRSTEYMGKMLLLAPDYKELIFNIFSRRHIADTLEYGFPLQSPIVQDYFRYLLTHAKVEDVKTAWEWLQNHSLTNDKLAGDYVDLLSKKGEYTLAVDTWQKYAGHYVGGYLKPNVVFNGGFESQPIQSGLDWRFSELPGVKVELDSNVSYSGKSSLRIEFDGKANIDFNGVMQDIVAHPGRYHFKARVRTSQLTTDQGVGFRLMDSSGGLNVQTMRVNGTKDWMPIDLDFVLSGPTRLLRVAVIRQSSWKFDNKVSGTVWIDDVSIVKQ
jgi:tetratricopeptide (TPR) repeat protein